MIRNEYVIIIDQTDYIMKNIIQEYWGKKTKDEIKFQKSPFPLDKYFKKLLFMATPFIWEQLKLES